MSDRLTDDQIEELLDARGNTLSLILRQLAGELVAKELTRRREALGLSQDELQAYVGANARVEYAEQGEMTQGEVRVHLKGLKAAGELKKLGNKADARRVEWRRMRQVYVASPYAIGDTNANVRMQMEAGNKLIGMGFTPFLPICMTHLWDFWSPKPRDGWLNYDLEWVHACGWMLRLPGESKGADREVAVAEGNGITVVSTYAELQTLWEKWKVDWKERNCKSELVNGVVKEVFKEEEGPVREGQEIKDVWWEVIDDKGNVVDRGQGYNFRFPTWSKGVYSVRLTAGKGEPDREPRQGSVRTEK